MTPTMSSFVVATLALLLVPGPSVIFAVTRAVALGRSAGLVTVVGLEAGLVVHILAAAAGVTALIAAFGPALTVVRIAGVGYLVALGVRHLLATPAGSDDAASGPTPRSNWVLFRDAFAVDLLNPQTMIFFLAFLPRFVHTGPTAPTSQLLVLGACVVLLAFCCETAYVLATTAVLRRCAGTGRREGTGWLHWLRGSRSAGVATGGVYLGLAAWFALG